MLLLPSEKSSFLSFLIESDQFCFTTLECMSVILMWQLFKKLIDSFIECEYDGITHWDSTSRGEVKGKILDLIFFQA